MTFVCKKMGVVRSILIILIFHILCVDAVLNENPIKKISGLDENEEKEALIVEKFRALLGLKSFHIKRPSNGDSQFLSPSPSPLPTIEPEAPSPSPSHFPLPHVYAHPFPPRHRSHRNPPTHKFHQHEDRGGRAKAILVGVLVSVGVASVICVIGLFWALRKFRNHTKKPKRTMPLCSKNRGSGGGSCENSSSQVGLNSTLDLFHLNSLGDDIDQHTRSLKQDSVTVNTNSNHRYHEKEVIISPEYYDNASSSSTKEILSDDKIITTECYSSDNESFHSLVDSHSSNVRLSNASDGNLSETLPHESPQLPIPKQNSVSNIELESPQSLQIPKPPPPPPPPPPLQMPLFSLHSLTSSSSSKSPPSSTFPNLSSPRDSESFSSLNQNIENEKNPSLPSIIPPPTCPPPPPPFRANNNNNVKTPPPPPSQLPQFTPRGKDGAPLPKLKPLHWDKVRAAPDRTMVWDKLRSSSFEFDEEMIESLFGYNLQHSMKNEETKSKSPSPSKHVLEPKRLQNITILSKALNVTAEQVCEALIQGRGLCLQQLEALVKMVPTKEEEDKLSSYKGDINEMGSAEKFVKAMLSVPFAFPRVDAMLYRETFEDEIVHLRNSFSMLEEACKELRSSRLFLKLLEAVLKTGNRMNVGTIRGGARAFKLDALLKLADVKGTDGKTTLLHFVVQEIIRSEGIRVSDSIMGKISQKSNNRTQEEKEEDYRRMGLELVSGLSTELYNVKKTATIDLDVLASSVSNLKGGVSKLRNLVHELHTDENSENFVDSMKVFLNYADRNLRNLQGDEDRVLARVKEITEYFHGDVSKEDANPLRIFVIVRDFMGMLDNVCKELRRSKLPRSPSPLAPFR